MSSHDRTQVTGFLAFGRFERNPAALLAAQCGRPFALIEVAYEAVDEFLASLDRSTFNRLLMLGVAGRATTMRIERVARNIVDASPDVRQFTRGPGPIDPSGPATLHGTLWTPSVCDRPSDVRCVSDDAGCYLCNYLYYRALQLFPDKRVGFLHVVPEDQWSIDRQLEAFADVIAEIEA